VCSYKEVDETTIVFLIGTCVEVLMIPLLLLLLHS